MFGDTMFECFAKAKRTVALTIAVVTALSALCVVAAPADGVSGSTPRNCLAKRRYIAIEPVGERLLIFHGRVRSETSYWLNRLPKPCKGMRPDSVLGTNSDVTTICKGDILYLREGPTSVCALGAFESITADQAEELRGAAHSRE